MKLPRLQSRLSAQQFVLLRRCIVTLVVSAPAILTAAPPEADVAFFESKIRPVLVEHCYKCHSSEADEVGGKLLLDTREGVLKGGETGPALVAGKPDDSLILQAIKHDGLEMPPGERLPEKTVTDFVTWIQQGAADPRTAGKTKPIAQGAQLQSDLWSLKPIQSPPIPEARLTNWPQRSLDHFTLSQMEAQKILPAADAPPGALVRRLYFDLIGLPPTAKETADFIAAYELHGRRAVEQLVDELLASRHFGERWGRYWLDVARYGESNGNDGLGRNPTFPHAWRFRDYVIAAFNDDVPFDQFVIEQLAGDLLPAETPEQRDRQLIATGFLALTAKPAKAMNDNFDMDVVADQIDVVGRGIMGLSVACARCHDHKFDPIPTRDYYALAGIFASTQTMWGMAGHEKLTAPSTDLYVLEAAARVPPPEDFVETVLVIESDTGKPKPQPKPKWPPGTPLAMGVRDVQQPADSKINIKGNAKSLGEVVPRGYLSVCSGKLATDHPVNEKQSGRLQLAQWLTSPEHPLTARVFVNRVWHHLFGAGIVRTPDDFGVYGERPTHPELLDHLATQFVSTGWSTKRLIREIVLSRTYQLSSQPRSEHLQGDAENRLWTRHNRRRLDAESLRDSMLAVSSQLDPAPAVGSLIEHRDILVNLAGNLHQPSHHRSVYLCYLRSSPPPELAPFDLPEFTSVVGKRETNTLPAQSLYLYNSPFVLEQAQALATLISAETDDDAQRVRQLFSRVFSRQPTELEQRESLQLIQQLTSDLQSEHRAWIGLSQALLMTNEFRYVD